MTATTLPRPAGGALGAAADPDVERQSHALQASARPLVALATQLRTAVLDMPEAMHQALAAAVARFERDAAALGCDERTVAAASYLLCTWVDEVVADTPWGAGGAGLLERFHGERDGSERVLRLLTRVAERPREERALLELFHTCFSLGLGGALRRSPDGARRLDELRRRVYLTLPRAPITLAPPWQSAVPPGAPALRRRIAIGGLVLLALGALGVYTASHLKLAGEVDEAFASMRALSETVQVAPAGGPLAAAGEAGPASGAGGTGGTGGAGGSGGPGLAATAAAGGRDTKLVLAARSAPPLAPALSDATARSNGGFVVRDETHRSVVSLPAALIYEPGSTTLTPTGAALLGQIAAALSQSHGKVLVIGHTDGADRRTARLPSAWHQSYEWARGVASELGRSLPAERLSSEGAADVDTDGDATGTRRRVDIVLYP